MPTCTEKATSKFVFAFCTCMISHPCCPQRLFYIVALCPRNMVAPPMRSTGWADKSVAKYLSKTTGPLTVARAQAQPQPCT